MDEGSDPDIKFETAEVLLVCSGQRSVRCHVKKWDREAGLIHSWVGAYQLILLSWKTDWKNLSSLIGSRFQLNKEMYGELFTSHKAPCLFFLLVDR